MLGIVNWCYFNSLPVNMRRYPCPDQVAAAVEDPNVIDCFELYNAYPP